MDMELRVQDAELRANEDGSLTVSGYVNKTGQVSNVLGSTKKFVEKIAKGAFSKAILSAQRDINFLAEHNNKQILASTRNGSLELTEDEQGLFMSANISPTSWGRDYYQLIKDGIHRNMSFGFRTLKDTWRSLEPGLFERTIEELDLFEVSVVFDPAYSQSTIDARGIGLVEEVEIPTEIEEESRNMEKLQEALESFGQKVDALTEEIREMRSAQEKAEELRAAELEELKAKEQREEQVQEQEEVDETSAEEEQDETKDEKSSEEKSESSEEEQGENQETNDKEDEEVQEEVEQEQERSNDSKPDFSEFRSRLDSLKQKQEVIS